MVWSRAMDVFPIVPTSAKVAWIFGVVSLVLIVVVVLMAWLAYSSNHCRVEVFEDRVRLVGDLWGRTISRTKLKAEEGRIVNLDEESGLQMRRRTWGTYVPGYATGWYRLKNGEKALLYVTKRDRVVYLPTTDGYSLLLSVTDPQRLLAAIRE